MKSKLIVVLVIILAVFIFINGSKDDTEIIKIGQVSALSGVGADIGEEERNGALLAVEQINKQGGINGNSIELISEDISLNKIKETASAFQKLINVDKVSAIVGPQWDEPAIIAAPIANDLETLVISPNSSPQVEKEIQSDYFFSTFYSEKAGIEELVRFAKRSGYTRIAIVQPVNIGFWTYTSNFFRESAELHGIEIISEEYGSDFGNFDYKTLIAKAEQANPDAIFGSYADLECLFIQQLSNQDLDIPLLSTISAGTPKALMECPDLLVDNLYFSYPRQGDRYNEFEIEYEKRFGNKPFSPSAVTSYDAVLVIADAIEKTNSTDSKTLRDYVANISFENGRSLPRVEFDELGFVKTPEETFEIRTVKDGEFVRAE